MPIYEEDEFDEMLDEKQMEKDRRAQAEKSKREKKQTDDWIKWVEESWRGN